MTVAERARVFANTVCILLLAAGAIYGVYALCGKYALDIGREQPHLECDRPALALREVRRG